ncbi:MAG: leucine-rich repeat domain-containing protein, partial [Xanthomonadales bacterium]|nr:leucine-rich repeat domain-containing protein [Xanthomonadales bacterium]
MRQLMFKHLSSSYSAALCFIALLLCAQVAWAEEDDNATTQQIIEQIIAEYGYLDAVAYSAAMDDLIANTPLPDADSTVLDSGSCTGGNDCVPIEETLRSIEFPGVRDVTISVRESNPNRSNSTFKVKWKKPERLPRDLRKLYELSHYEVYLVKDNQYFERFEIHKILRDDGKTRLPRKIRFRRREPGNYQVYVRAMYQAIVRNFNSGGLSGDDQQGLGQEGLGQQGPEQRGLGQDGLSGGSFTASGFGFGGTNVGPSSKIEVLLTESINIPLYQCLTSTMQLSPNALINSVNHIVCPDAGISSLQGLEHFSGLQVLNLSNQVPGGVDNTFTDISPLTNGNNAPDLTNLNLSGVSGLYLSLNAHLDELDSLRYLSLANMGLTQLPNFAPLGGFGSSITIIDSLNLSGNNITSLNGLSDYDAINHLWLDGNNLGNAALSNTSPLKNYDRIVTLSLKNIGLSSVQYANLPTQLGFLLLDDNPGVSSFWGFVNQQQLNSADVVYQVSLDQNYQAACPSLDSVGKWVNTNIDPDGGCMNNSTYFGAMCLYFTTSNCNPDPTLAPETTQAGSIEQALGATPSAPTASSVCGHQAYIRPSYCAAGSVSGFEAYYDEDHKTVRFHWQSVPASWGTNYYEIRYQSTGLNPVTGTTSINSYASNHHALQLTRPNETSHYRFQIRTCRNALSCGSYTPLKHADYPLFKPGDLQLQQLSNDTATISWRYPDTPLGSTVPQFYEIKPLFDVDGISTQTILYSADVNGTWTANINGVSAYPAGAIQVSACRNTAQGKECSRHAEISVIPGPAVNPSINTPSSVSLTATNNQNEFSLTWVDGNTPSADYYRIIDHTIGSRVAGQRAYAVEETHLNVKRYLADSVQFEVSACRINENGDDFCSIPYTTNAMPVTTQPVLSEPAKLCWYVTAAQDPDGDSLPNPDVNDVAKVNYLWTFASGDTPQQYEIHYNGIDVDVPQFGFPGNGRLGTHAFENAEYNPSTGEWYWHQEDALLSSGSIYQNANVQVKALSKGTSKSKVISWPYQIVDDVPTFDVSTRCSNPPPPPPSNQNFGANPVGGPGDLQPGHWSNETEHRGNGWRFYWANQIRYDEVHQAFGVSYDLIGFWYTYKIINGQWSPVWYFTRMQLVESDSADGTFYEGALVYPRRSTDGNHSPLDQQVGSVKLWFDHSGITFPSGDDNQKAFIQVQLDQGDGLISGVSHEIVDIALHQENSNTNSSVPLNRNDHYNGIWTTDDLFDDGYVLAANDFFMVEWMERNLHSMGLNFFDSNGEPIWVASLHCAQGTACNPDPQFYGEYVNYDDFFTVYPGNNPLGVVPDSWGDVASHRQNVAGAGGRTHLDFNGAGAYKQWHQEDYNASEVCLDFSFTVGGRSVAKQYGS